MSLIYSNQNILVIGLFGIGLIAYIIFIGFFKAESLKLFIKRTFLLIKAYKNGLTRKDIRL